jgi:hypothetical protein
MTKPFDASQINRNNFENFKKCQKPLKPRFALQMNYDEGFTVRTANGVRQVGEKGDFLIIDTLGNQEVCSKGNFQNDFVLIDDFNDNQDFSIPSKKTSLERLFAISRLPTILPNGSAVYIKELLKAPLRDAPNENPYMTNQEFAETDWPEQIECRKENKDGTFETAIFDFNLATDAEREEPNLENSEMPVETDSVQNLIDNGGFQTHSDD